MNTTQRVKLATEMVAYVQEHDTKTPMRDLFVEKYGKDLKAATVMILFAEWVKVARMAGVSDIQKRGHQWTENSVIIREYMTII